MLMHENSPTFQTTRQIEINQWFFLVRFSNNEKITQLLVGGITQEVQQYVCNN